MILAPANGGLIALSNESDCLWGQRVAKQYQNKIQLSVANQIGKPFSHAVAPVRAQEAASQPAHSGLFWDAK
jgi:hypothetical protein